VALAAALYGEFDSGLTKGRPKGAACGSHEILRPRASGRRFVERTAQFTAHSTKVLQGASEQVQETGEKRTRYGATTVRFWSDPLPNFPNFRRFTTIEC
jgi:hypothetical protein